MTQKSFLEGLVLDFLRGLLNCKIEARVGCLKVCDQWMRAVRHSLFGLVVPPDPSSYLWTDDSGVTHGSRRARRRRVGCSSADVARSRSASGALSRLVLA